MSFLTQLSDVQKGDTKQVRENLKLQHENKQGVYKNRNKDSLTCWGNSCGLCFECTNGGCYLCGIDIWDCKCGFGNIRKQPHLMQIHFEDYIALIREHYE